MADEQLPSPAQAQLNNEQESGGSPLSRTFSTPSQVVEKIYYDGTDDLEASVKYWKSEVYSNGSSKRPGCFKPQGYPSSLIKGFQATDPVPKYTPMSEYMAANAAGEMDLSRQWTVEELKARFEIGKDEQWTIPEECKDLILGPQFIQCCTFLGDLDEHTPKKIKQSDFRGLDHKRAKRILESTAKSQAQKWLKTTMYAFTVHTFLKYADDAQFLAAINSQDPGKLTNFFDLKLTKVTLMHCLEKPWGKAISLGWIIHPGPVAEELKEVHRKLFFWCRILISSTMTDIYRHAVQMTKEEKVPKEDWLQIKANYEGLPTTKVEQKFRVNITDLPAAPTIGLIKRVRTAPGRTAHRRTTDNAGNNDEFTEEERDQGGVADE